MSVKNAMKKIYNERKDFILIGLTGRTGSGCTTVSNLLCETFENLNPKTSLTYNFTNREERKYNVLYNYAKINWRSFITIKVPSIITTFLLEYKYKTFIKYLKKEIGEKITYEIEKKEIGDKILKNKYNDIHNKRIKIKKMIEDDQDNLGNYEVYNFFYIEIPKFSEALGKILKEFKINIDNKKYNLYYYIYQKFGNNCRASGNPFKKKLNERKILIFSQRINTMVKILRKKNLLKENDNNKYVCIVIDSLKNPFEVSFFKERYSAFYLISVNTDDNERIRRLNNSNLTFSQIKNLDDIEYNNKLKNEEIFSSQNIARCLELADIHIYNSKDNTNEFSELKIQLIKYISLIMQPGLVSPTHIERCMQLAYNVKLNSGCLSRKVGAVVTDINYSIRTVGWNCVPEGQIPCNLRDILSKRKGEDIEAYSDFENEDKEYKNFINDKTKDIEKEALDGRLMPYCFKDFYNSYKNNKNQVHTRSLHAEENAFLQITKYGGISLKNGYLFTTASPCELCSKKAYQIGIKKIYYIDPYPGISNQHIIKSGKSKPEMVLFQGAIGIAYNKLYTPIIDYKDELYCITEMDL